MIKSIQKQQWQMLGQIFKAEGQFEWLQSHTAMPQVLHLHDDIFRIYFGSRNTAQSASVNYIEIDINEPDQILNISEHPVLLPGDLGCFDDNAVYPGNIIQNGEELRMYYMGRSNGEPPLYTMAIGLAKSCDGGKTFTRFSQAPILGRSEIDPYMTSTPYVIKESSQWFMWYLSGRGWKSLDPAVSLYRIHSAVSADGINWKPCNNPAIDLEVGETNIAAPSVIQTSQGHQMWYCKVNNLDHQYHLGYAESNDGVNWIRQDETIEGFLSGHSWDNQAQAYPCVFKHLGKTYMIYSGNGNGKEGIGLAVLES